MTSSHPRAAFFAGLVFDEEGNPLETALVGETPCYVVQDGDFRRHIESEGIDRQVLEVFREQVIANREVIVPKMMEMLGKEDLFTKAALENSLQHLERVIEYGLPEDARDMLGMTGFRIVVNVHGEIVEIKVPGETYPDE